jgi:putative nucleotidyltransferase with HDIG domain
MESLEKKTETARNTAKSTCEINRIRDVAELTDVVSKLTDAYNIEEILDVTFRCVLAFSAAETGSIHIVNDISGAMFRVRSCADTSSGRIITSESERTLLDWVRRNGRAVFMAGTVPIPDSGIPVNNSICCQVIMVPIKLADSVIGIITCLKSDKSAPFSQADLYMVEMLAVQTGIAINNSSMISSVRQKLDALSIMSAYSGQLMKLLDENDVIKCMFTAVRNNFPVDIIGLLVVQKRNHVFLYWSRSSLPERVLHDLSSSIVSEYNKVSRSVVTIKRVSYRQILPVMDSSAETVNVPEFSHIVPIVGEASDYGVMYFGSSEDFNASRGGLELLSTIASQTGIALTNARLYGDIKENYIRTIKALAIAVDAKDTYTHGHSENVMNIAEEIANEMGLEPRRVGFIRDAGLLHDIGKIGIPGNILNKPGTLTCEEFNGVMKTHSMLGANIVKEVPFLRELYALILYHHENFDGSGYPEGLGGDDIPIGARIIHVADAFEAMTSNRPYRISLGRDEAVKRIMENSGSQFDPSVVNAFLKLACRKGWLE